jgi:hypothetical protein
VFSFLVVVYCVFSRLLCSGRLIRDVRLPFFLLIPEAIFIGTTIGLLPFTQLIYLAVHEGLLICRLGQMGKWGGVSKTMDFRIKLFFLSFFINNEVILERGLYFLIIPISVSSHYLKKTSSKASILAMYPGVNPLNHFLASPSRLWTK